jgi:hypothetical protein
MEEGSGRHSSRRLVGEDGHKVRESEGGGEWIFFYFDHFLIIILEMNPTKLFFSNLALFSHAVHLE